MGCLYGQSYPAKSRFIDNILTVRYTVENMTEYLNSAI